MVKRRRVRRPLSAAPQCVAQALGPLLRGLGGTPLRAKLATLWRHWEQAVGAELAEVALPLGARGRQLLLGAPDAMQLQELHFLSAEVLDRVNAFLQCDAFEGVKVTLASEGKFCPPAPTPATRTGPPQRPSSPRPSGKYLSTMDPASPIARCYARFVQELK